MLPRYGLGISIEAQHDCERDVVIQDLMNGLRSHEKNSELPDIFLAFVESLQHKIELVLLPLSSPVR